MIQDVIDLALDGGLLTAEQIAALLETPLDSPAAGLIRSAARRMSARACDGLAEVHAQVGLNAAPCPRNCRFCAFAACNGVFSEATQLSPEEAVRDAQVFERDGANAVYLMGTANYPFERFVEMGQEVRKALKPETVLIGNVGDFTLDQGRRLVDAGFDGVYHAVRMGEGRDTDIDVSTRLETFRHAAEVGLSLGTCVEPIGPEHTTAEIVEKTLITRDARPIYSGAARRISIPGSELAAHGQVSEARMAHILAVVRLAVGDDVAGNCTHEPCVSGPIFGANLLWAEAGSNPRDTSEKTEQVRGLTVARCREMFAEAEWPVLDGPSRFHRRP